MRFTPLSGKRHRVHGFASASPQVLAEPFAPRIFRPNTSPNALSHSEAERIGPDLAARSPDDGGQDQRAATIVRIEAPRLSETATIGVPPQLPCCLRGNSLLQQNNSLFVFQDSLFLSVGNFDGNTSEDKVFLLQVGAWKGQNRRNSLYFPC
jgi:hypothetical protein